MDLLEPFRVVPFTPEHQSGVVDLAEEILVREFKVQENLAEETDLLDISRHYSAPGCRFLVAIAADEVVGSGGILRLSDDDCEMKRLYVQSKHRRHGIASQIVGMIVPFAQEQGYKRLLLEISGEMRNTIAGYARYGLKPMLDTESAPREADFLVMHL